MYNLSQHQRQPQQPSSQLLAKNSNTLDPQKALIQSKLSHANKQLLTQTKITHQAATKRVGHPQSIIYSNSALATQQPPQQQPSVLVSGKQIHQIPSQQKPPS
jgi:hypothetical protein